MGVYIELNGQLLVHLNIKLLDAILTKNTEHTLARISSWYFDYILLRHPCVTSTLRHSAVSRQNGNNSSC